MRRRLLLILASVFAAAVLALLTLPWWMGGALRLAPDSLGIDFARYERVGYARFALRDVEYQRGNVRVTLTRVEADTPTLWLWRRMTANASEVVVDRWTVEVRAKADATPPPPGRPRGWMPLRTTLRKVAAKLDQWLPRARAGEGVVRWKTGELSVGSATWSGRTLAVKRFALKQALADLTATFPADADEIRLEARLAEDLGSAQLTSRGADVTGAATWWEQTATFEGRFADRGWLPADAVLEAAQWNVPASKAKLGGLYATVRGRGRVEWSEQHFRAEVTAQGEPLAKKKAPPLEMNLRAQGDLQAFTVDALRVALPGVVANLSEPVTIDRRGTFRDGAARFAVEANLAEQPWIEAKGAMTGEATLVSEGGRAPVVRFRFEAKDIAAQGVAVLAADVRGEFNWPRLEVAAGSLAGAEGERIEWKGGWDFRAKEILPATVEGRLRRATIARWLPAQPKFDALALKAEAHGPVAALQHAGEVTADDVQISGLKPLALALSWRGRGAAADQFALRAQAAETELSLKGAVDREAMRIAGLELKQRQEERLTLTAPATVRWRPAVQIESLQLAGPEGAVDAALTWGETGSMKFAVRNFASSWLSDIVALPGPAWQLMSVAVTGSWDRGPMAFSAVLGVGIELGGGRHAAVHLAARGDGDGVRLEALRAAEGAASIVNATGSVPAVFTPGGAKFMTIDPTAPLAIEAATAPNAEFWQELAQLTGLELKEPRVFANVKGTWRRPLGDVRLQVERVAADPSRFKRPLPTIEALDVALNAAPDGVQLERFALRVEGQALSAQGKLPVGEADWSRIFKEPLVFARGGADLRVEIPDADLAAFARFLPAVLAPKGRLHVDASYRRGDVTGNLRLSGAATRPLGPLGVVQEIEADIALAGDALELRTVKALSGGEDVQLTGRIELPMLRLPPSAPADEREPRFDVALKGNNLPFVRRTGLLVRGDLDLKLNTTERGGERVTGSVRLRDSLFLQDVRALLPTGTSSRSRRPPYFSVENPPLNRWRLDVNVEGQQFMRLRTTVFNGVASARFHLGGTLEEPIAIGDVTIDEGRIRLPFAGFEVREGRVTLTREQPFEPQIWVAAETRRFGYDLRMEITGAASAPVLAFSSSPPLEHGQVLLMVMAGEAPKEEVTYTDQQRATKIGTYLGQSLLASFGDAENGDRLTISSGEKISELGRETVEVEYQVNDRLSLTGEYDEFDDYNAGVKWRVYSRGGEEDESNDEK